MRQFDVVKNRRSSDYPLVVVLQSDLLSGLSTRWVAPLALASGLPRPITRLHPTLVVGGKKYVVLTQLAGAVRIEHLGTVVANAGAQRTDLVSAVDVLLSGV